MRRSDDVIKNEGQSRRESLESLDTMPQEKLDDEAPKEKEDFIVIESSVESHEFVKALISAQMAKSESQKVSFTPPIVDEDDDKDHEAFVGGEPVGHVSSKKCSLKNPPNPVILKLFFDANKDNPNPLRVTSCSSLKDALELIQMAKSVWGKDEPGLEFSPAAIANMKAKFMEKTPRPDDYAWITELKRSGIQESSAESIEISAKEKKSSPFA